MYIYELIKKCNLYVNDLLRDMPEGSILFYADDTVIISSEDTWSMTQDKIKQLLD